MVPQFAQLQNGYTRLWETMTIRSEWAEKANQAARAIVNNKREYRIVETLVGVPWFVVGIIHQMESGGNFKTHLHNGDALSARTANEPSGRPINGNPPFQWYESAADALHYDKLDQVTDWTCERLAYELEKYNGFRSRTEHNINTPYLWSGCTHYDRGKFVRDNIFDANFRSKQVGAMPILRSLMLLDPSVASALASQTPTAQAADAGQLQLDVKELQSRLAKLPFYGDEIDGFLGPKTRNAIRAFLVTQQITDVRNWTKARLLVAGKQALCQLDGIDVGEIDGIHGPQTEYALSVYEARKRGDRTAEAWRDQEEKKPPLVKAPPKSTCWPGQSDVERFFGEKGENQTKLIFPYPMRLAWQTSTVCRSTVCHEKIHDAALRVLTRALDHYGIDKIRALGLDLFGGCLNVRLMRGGSAWSMHSWGIAFDFDPDRNQLRWGKDKAAFAHPEYERWFDLWEEEGAISLGRSRNYDWMHTQFAVF